MPLAARRTALLVSVVRRTGSVFASRAGELTRPRLLFRTVVDNNPQAFVNAYWEVNALYIYTPIN